MNAKDLMILVVMLLIVGCNPKDPDIILVKKFWKAVQVNDDKTIRTLINNPENINMFKGKASLELPSIKIGQKLENGNIKFSYKPFCYPEISSETKLVRNERNVKVDVAATLWSLYRDLRNISPLKKYCYSFNDHKMSGKISGIPITLMYLNEKEGNVFGKPHTSYTLTAEPCLNNSCVDLTTPRILVDNLDFTGDGGNITFSKTITLYTPSINNRIVTNGSYRISRTAEKTKLEISFKIDEENFINGYIEY